MHLGASANVNFYIILTLLPRIVSGGVTVFFKLASPGFFLTLEIRWRLLFYSEIKLAPLLDLVAKVITVSLCLK